MRIFDKFQKGKKDALYNEIVIAMPYKKAISYLMSPLTSDNSQFYLVSFQIHFYENYLKLKGKSNNDEFDASIG